MAFTILVPGLVAVWVPHLIANRSAAAGGLWQLGSLLILVGTVTYALCLFAFLLSGGSPAIFFARHLKFLIGEEPPNLVSRGLYRVSRNPMYVGVLLVVFGQAIIFASGTLALYGMGLALAFHLVVVGLEEPHLRKQRGSLYVEYCSHVPRWLGWPR